MKLCEDCKHNRRDWMLGQRYAQCNAIKNPSTGRRMWFCSTERMSTYDDINACGSTGRLWEKRVTLWARIKSMVTA